MTQILSPNISALEKLLFFFFFFWNYYPICPNTKKEKKNKQKIPLFDNIALLGFTKAYRSRWRWHTQ